MTMNPDWKSTSASAIDFPRKVFVKSTENAANSGRPAQTRPDRPDIFRGDEARKFYEEVCSSEPSLKQNGPETARPERRTSARSSGLRVRPEFREPSSVDQSLLRRAFVAAQNDDLVSIIEFV